MKVSKL